MKKHITKYKLFIQKLLLFVLILKVTFGVGYSQVIIKKNIDQYKKSIQDLGYEAKNNTYKNTIEYPDSYKDPEAYDFSYECNDAYGSCHVLVFSNQSGVSKVVILDENEDAYSLRLKKLTNTMNMEEWKRCFVDPQIKLGGYGYNKNYYTGWALYKVEKVLFKGKRNLGFSIYLDKQP